MPCSVSKTLLPLTFKTCYCKQYNKELQKALSATQHIINTHTRCPRGAAALKAPPSRATGNASTQAFNLNLDPAVRVMHCGGDTAGSGATTFCAQDSISNAEHNLHSHHEPCHVTRTGITLVNAPLCHHNVQYIIYACEYMDIAIAVDPLFPNISAAKECNEGLI